MHAPQARLKLLSAGWVARPLIPTNSLAGTMPLHWRASKTASATDQWCVPWHAKPACVRCVVGLCMQSGRCQQPLECPHTNMSITTNTCPSLDCLVCGCSSSSAHKTITAQRRAGGHHGHAPGHTRASRLLMAGPASACSRSRSPVCSTWFWDACWAWTTARTCCRACRATAALASSSWRRF